MPRGVYKRSKEQIERCRTMNIGRHRTEKWKKERREASLGKNNIFYGRRHSEEAKEKNRIAHINKKYPTHSGSNHENWLGDDVGYSGIHKRMRKLLLKPDLCQICDKKKRLELACITGIYNMDFSNWGYLCRRCHTRHDSIVLGVKHGRHANSRT